MDAEQRRQILNRAKSFFRDEIVDSHINSACYRASSLSGYNIHPFLLKYLANFLEGNDNPRSIAKALIFPRLLGTSITTIFGSKAQRMVSELFEGMGSAVSGIDIEFIDSIDNRRKYCQLKSGPNTINKDDIKTVVDHFSAVRNLARVNNLTIGLNDLIVGIVYGEEDNLNNHYRKIAESYPVYVGQTFWYHLTGQENFYLELINAIGEVALEVDGRERLEQAITRLAADIEENYS